MKYNVNRLLSSITTVFSILLVVTSLFFSCKKESTPDLKGMITVNTATAYAPANIYVTNRVRGAASYSWDFGGGLMKDSINPLPTFNSIQPDTIRYSLPGTYFIRLVASNTDGSSSIFEKEITILKGEPKITANGRVGASVALGSLVSLSIKDYIEYPNQSLSVTWEIESQSFDGKDITYTFSNGGLIPIKCTVNDGVDVMILQDTLEVKILSKTLYFFDKLTDKIYKKLIPKDAVASDPSLDLSVKEFIPTRADAHIFQMKMSNDALLLFDFSTGFYPQTPLGDYQITVYDLLSLKKRDLISVSESLTNSPMTGTIYEGTVYWLGRLNTYFKTSFAGENQEPISLTNQASGPSGSTSSAYNGGMQVVNGDMWFSKSSHGSGGINKMPLNGGAISSVVIGAGGTIPLPVHYNGVRDFLVLPDKGKILYVAQSNLITGKSGIFMSDIDGTNSIPIVEYTDYAANGTTHSQSITQLAYDSDESYLYWAYRKGDTSTFGDVTSTIVRAKIDLGIGLVGSIETVATGYAVLGLVIDDMYR